ncbi:MAG: PilN domain-containing protein, partial [Deltaproteobacteria bacterium]|nr:PilN domain-containing protein [Deltaproteobacteria bacterium]
DDRNAAAKMMMQVAQSIPDEVWLTQFAVTDDVVKFEGSTPGYNQVSDFIRNLNGTSQFSDITLSGIHESSASLPGGGADKDTKVQVFDLQAKRRKGG